VSSTVTVPQTELSVILNEIEERANKATEGPWEFVDSTANQMVVKPLGKGRDGIICALGGIGARTPEFQFIASARTDVPALVKALHRAVAYISVSGIPDTRLEVLATITAILNQDVKP
jgi:hypothetical protein